VAVKKQLQIVNTGFETKLKQSSTRIEGIIDELANQMVDHRSEVETTISKLDQDVSRRFTRQRESIDQANQAVNQEKSATQRRLVQMNAKTVALQSKIADAPSRVAVAEESRATSNVLLSPSIVKSEWF
jgi:predicted  nucleic acid-binding Zn-ribbon protein